MERIKSVVTTTAGFLNDVSSFIVFTLLDLLDIVLCYVYKVADFFIESEWKPCYCSSTKEATTTTITTTSRGKIVVPEPRESKIVRLTCSKLRLEEISDTLYTRRSFVSEVSKSTNNICWSKKINGQLQGSRKKARSTFAVNSTIVEMLQGKVGGHQKLPIPRWSDCDCRTCISWTSSCERTLFVKVDGATDYRLHAVDLLGFGRSPKPTDSLYTLREHLEMIERSVIQPYKVKSFHIVAHSLGCILALALAVKHPASIKSLTLIAPH
ncbi:hypothetical protein OROGR_001840 [Orobanche gracilis]